MELPFLKGIALIDMEGGSGILRQRPEAIALRKTGEKH